MTSPISRSKLPLQGTTNRCKPIVWHASDEIPRCILTSLAKFAGFRKGELSARILRFNKTTHQIKPDLGLCNGKNTDTSEA